MVRYIIPGKWPDNDKAFIRQRKDNMTKETKNTAGETRKIQLCLAKLENLGAARASLFAFVEEDLKKLDAARKEERAKLTGIFTSMADVTLAVTTANVLAPTEQGADDARRKQISRRRGFLVRALAASYREYDFSVSKGRNGGNIEFEAVGDNAVREARELLHVVQRLESLGVKLPAIAESKLANAIRRQANGTDTVKTVSAKPVNVENGFALAGIDVAASNAAMLARLTAATSVAADAAQVAAPAAKTEEIEDLTGLAAPQGHKVAISANA